MQSFWMPKKQPLYAPMLSTFGGGSARGFGASLASGGGYAVLSGGSVTTYTGGQGTYTQHAYLATSTTSITITKGGIVQMLLVGGGGGGGVLGGGGGGGAVIVAEGEVPAGTYAARVGDGPPQRQSGWSTSSSSSSDKGQSTYIQFGGSIGTVEAGPGGGGRSYSNGGVDTSNQNVGNQGGWGYLTSSQSDVNAKNPSFLSGNFSGGNIPTSFTYRVFYGGNRGGFGAASGNCCPCNGGGGAGAGANGGDNNNSDSSSNTAHGGDGVQAVINGDFFYGNTTGSTYYWGGGGPTDAYCSSGPFTPGKGGAGGSADNNSSGQDWSYGDTNALNSGTRGFPSSTNFGRGGDGGANTGGGGGAGSDGSGNTNTLGGLGGSGIIVLRVLS